MLGNILGSGVWYLWWLTLHNVNTMYLANMIHQIFYKQIIGYSFYLRIYFENAMSFDTVEQNEREKILTYQTEPAPFETLIPYVKLF